MKYLLVFFLLVFPVEATAPKGPGIKELYQEYKTMRKAIYERDYIIEKMRKRILELQASTNCV